MVWVPLNSDPRLATICSTADCEGHPIWRQEFGNIGCNYCADCRDRIEAALATEEQSK